MEDSGEVTVMLVPQDRLDFLDGYTGSKKRKLEEVLSRKKHNVWFAWMPMPTCRLSTGTRLTWRAARHVRQNSTVVLLLTPIYLERVT